MITIFNNVPFLGSLYMEHPLLYKSEPTIFVCLDQMGARYLCVVHEPGREWYVGRITNERLLHMLMDRLPINAALRGCHLNGIITRQSERKWSFTAGVPKVDPACDMMLGLWKIDPEVRAYGQALRDGVKNYFERYKGFIAREKPKHDDMKKE